MEPKVLGSAMDDPAQVFQNEADQAVVDSLRNEIVLREIFGHLSSRELFQLSCVNKLWHREARIMMRERGNVIANFRQPNLCAQAEAFVSALEGMTVVPYSAICISIPCDFDHDDACRCHSEDELRRRIHPQSFSQPLALKSAEIALRGPWWVYQNCPAFQLAKVVLQHSSGSLEDIELEVDLRQDYFIQLVFHEQDCNFPRLKCLSLPDSNVEIARRAYASYIKPLVSRAPNLQELFIETLDPHSGKALEGCTAATIEVGGCASAPFDGISENVVSTVKLTNIELIYTGPNFNFARFNRIAPVLLQASHSMLSRLYPCPLLLPALMSYGVRLDFVTEFEMEINFSLMALTQPEVLGLLRNFNFTRILPNLRTVTMNRSYAVPGPLPYQMTSMFEQVEADLMEPQPGRAENIQELILCDGLFEDAPGFWVTTFPSIRILRLGEDRQKILSEDFPIASIWKHWPDLEKLVVSLRDMRGIFPSADSAFYGIFPEECDELRDKDEEYLKKVNIVPVAPTINCFRNLKTLVLDFYSKVFAQDLAGPELSRLTKLIAFASRRPSLTIVLKAHSTEVYEALRHIEPYATVVLGYVYYDARAD